MGVPRGRPALLHSRALSTRLVRSPAPDAARGEAQATRFPRISLAEGGTSPAPALQEPLLAAGKEVPGLLAHRASRRRANVLSPLPT